MCRPTQLATPVRDIPPLRMNTAHTVTTAGLDVTVPALLLTMTLKAAALSDLTVAGVVWLLDVAPETAAPLFIH